MRKIFKFLSSRFAIICYLLLLQLALIFAVALSLTINFWYYYAIMTVISFSFVIVIINDKSNPSFKIAWIVPILIFPIFGVPLYFIFGTKRLSNRVVNRLIKTFKQTSSIIKQDKNVIEELNCIDKNISKQSAYIYKTASSPIYKNTYTRFLESGEIFFTALIEELNKAEKFIFFEYFIIQNGKMWDKILDILVKKVSEGVDVRLIYDDFGTIMRLPKDYPEKMCKLGIKTHVFNPFKPSLDGFLNYRDHRKISIIDGHICFTGGVNLADEYINEVSLFGYWKDSSVLLKGDAVSSFTVMFLQLWYYLENEQNNDKQNYSEFLSTKSYLTDGFVQPFGDSPLSGHLTGELAYMNIINSANDYIFITTPYLVLDNEMITALSLASQSGVDVRIITPSIPDKKLVYAVTRANYPVLLGAGVKIYEYCPGFIHSKTIVCDNLTSIVGTTNFDFRSFYLHFENGVFMYKSSCVSQVRDEFVKMLDISSEITFNEYKKFSLFQRFIGKLLRLFSPLF